MVDAERRKNRAHLQQCEDNVAKLRADSAAFAPSSTAGRGGADAEQALRTVLAGAQGLLVFADRGDPVVQHLAALASVVSRYLGAQAEASGFADEPRRGS